MNWELKEKGIVTEVQDFIKKRGYENEEVFKDIMSYDTNDKFNEEYNYYNNLLGKYIKLVNESIHEKSVQYKHIDDVKIESYNNVKEVMVHISTWTYRINKTYNNVYSDYNYNYVLCNHYVDKFAEWEVMDADKAKAEIDKLTEASYEFGKEILNIKK